MRFLEVVVALAIKEFEQRRPKLRSRKKPKINSQTHMYLFMKVSRVVLRGVWFREKVLKHTCFAFELFAMNATTARRVTPP